MFIFLQTCCINIAGRKHGRDLSSSLTYLAFSCQLFEQLPELVGGAEIESRSRPLAPYSVEPSVGLCHSLIAPTLNKERKQLGGEFKIFGEASEACVVRSINM